MNPLKLVSVGALIAACTSAFALNQGCVVTINDATGDAATTNDAAADGGTAASDGATAADGASAADGAAADGGDACNACSQASCAAELSACATPLADKSNVVTTAGDPNLGKTFCVALDSAYAACEADPVISADTTKLNTCYDTADQTYPNGVAPTTAITDCQAAKCAAACK